VFQYFSFLFSSTKTPFLCQFMIFPRNEENALHYVMKPCHLIRCIQGISVVGCQLIIFVIEHWYIDTWWCDCAILQPLTWIEKTIFYYIVVLIRVILKVWIEFRSHIRALAFGKFRFASLTSAISSGRVISTMICNGNAIWSALCSAQIELPLVKPSRFVFQYLSFLFSSTKTPFLC